MLDAKEKRSQNVLEQANYYLSGKSLREIADIYGVSHVTIRTNFLQKLKSIDPDIYMAVVSKMNDKSPENAFNEDIIKRVLLVYNLLVEEDKTVLEIVDILNSGKEENEWVSEFTVYRDLTVRLPRLVENSHEHVTIDMINNAKAVLKRHSKQNITKGTSEEKSDAILEDVPSQKKDSEVTPFKIIWRFYPDKRKRMNFLSKACLTFGVRLETLSYILELDPEKLRMDFEMYSNYNSSLSFLFKHGFVSQYIAKERFLDYLQKFGIAVVERNTEKVKMVLEILEDREALNFKTKHKPGGPITENDIAAILAYQLKYGLSSQDIASIFNIDHSVYSRKVRDYIKDKPELKSAFEYITDFYARSYWRKIQ